MHGFGATGITNFRLLPSLIKHFKVIFVDLPGFGKSDRTEFSFASPEKTIKFFVLPIVSLVNFLKLKKFILIAHSLGAFLGAHMVPYLKDRLAAVFLVGAAGFTYKKFSKNETEVLVDEFSRKWKVHNSKMVELARYIIFEKKLPIFNYLPKEVMKKYIQTYFTMQDMVLTLKERNLMIDYF